MEGGFGDESKVGMGEEGVIWLVGSVGRQGERRGRRRTELYTYTKGPKTRSFEHTQRGHPWTDRDSRRKREQRGTHKASLRHGEEPGGGQADLGHETSVLCVCKYCRHLRTALGNPTLEQRRVAASDTFSCSTPQAPQAPQALQVGLLVCCCCWPGRLARARSSHKQRARLHPTAHRPG